MQLKVYIKDNFCPLVLFTERLDMPAHHFDDALGDGHAKSRSLNSAYRCRIRPCKRLVNHLEKFRIHAHAVITDAELEQSEIRPQRFLFDDLHDDGAAVLRIFDSVRKYVEQNLIQPQFVAHDFRIANRLHVHLEGEILRIDIGLGDIRERLDNFGQIFGTFRKEHLARFNTAHVQYIVDKRKQMVRTLFQFFQIIHHQFFIVYMRHGQFRKAHNRIHRRANIVTHVREERRLCTVRRLCHRKRLLQHRLVHTGHANLFVLIGKADDKRLFAFIDRDNLAFAKVIDAIDKFKTRDAVLLEKRHDVLDKKPRTHLLDAFRRNYLIGKEADSLVIRQAI